MKKKIIYIVKDALHSYPPCISQMVILKELGIEVFCIAETCDDATLKVLNDAGIVVELLGKLLPKKSFYGRIMHWLKFKKNVKRQVDKIYNKGDVIWYGTERTAMVVSDCFKDKKTILNVLELYAKETLIGKLVKKTVHKCENVVACELNRARIMKIWYQLEKLPFVMPNKPYYELRQQKSEKVDELLGKLQGKRYILYQGILSLERPLDKLAEALNNTKEHYTFVIIGEEMSNKQKMDSMLKHLSSIYPDTIYGGYFPAPQHLYITQNAHIGVAFYDTTSINTIFCAPNKTYEYAKYRVPIIGSNIPGLELSIEKSRAGICVDINSSEQIAKGIDCIEDKYEEFLIGTENFYNTTDNIETMNKILEVLDLK